MNEFEKQRLLENINYTSLHVAKVNDLVDQHNRIHRVPFHTISAILTALILFFFLWSIGLVNVIHAVADKVATSIVNIEYVSQDKIADDAVENKSDLQEEEEPLIDISFITNIFTAEPKYSTSGVFKYAIIVALFDAIIIFGLIVGLTYSIYYGYHIYNVSRHKDKLSKIVKEVNEELKALEQSIVPEEYWHVSYLQRMIRYIEQDRVDSMRECLDLLDLDIRHKQIVNALVNNEWIDPKSLSDSVMHPKSKVYTKSKLEGVDNSAN